MTLANGEGRCVGGHMLGGNVVFTTAEIVLVDLPDWVFRREYDEALSPPLARGH